MPLPVNLPPEVFMDPAGRVPPAYMVALAKHESSFNPSIRHPGSNAVGLYQITQKALDGYNERNSTHHTLVDMLDPMINAGIATDHLNFIMSQWAARHGTRIRQDWNDPEWLALLTYGYNAGHNGISLIVNAMRPDRSITVDAIARLAPNNRWGNLLRDPTRIAFAKAVARDALGASRTIQSELARAPSATRPAFVIAALLAAVGVGVVVAMESSRAKRDESEDDDVIYQ